MRRVAGWLGEHPGVERVSYPGLPSHPQHELARRQMDGFGGMVAFELAADRGGRATGPGGAADLLKLAESLGGVESLIEHPGLMTHATLADSPLALPGNLVRLSVGIESVDDLIADLDQALALL